MLGIPSKNHDVSELLIVKPVFVITKRRVRETTPRFILQCLGEEETNENVAIRTANWEKDKLKFFGLHWNEEGICADILVIKRLITMFEQLKIHQCSPHLYPNLSKDNKKFLVDAEKDYLFWTDALNFVNCATQELIANKGLTHRKFGSICKEFICGKPKERKNILNRLQINQK